MKAVLWAGLVVWAAGLFYAWVLCRAADDPDPACPDEVDPWDCENAVNRFIIDNLESKR